MRGDRSAYETLGLDAGADRASVDAAFRALIKQFHPDRPGGDRARAEELIAAYRRLSGKSVAIDDLVFHDHPADRRVSAIWQILGLLLVIALLLLALLAGPFDSGFGSRLRAIDLPGGSVKSLNRDRDHDPLAVAIDDAALERAVASAHRDFRSKDEMELAAISRDCHSSYRAAPSVVGFDRCVAYDLAIVALQDRDPMRDLGPFREVGMVRRHWAEARALTNDSYRIDSRLDQLKLKVELMLVPYFPPPPPPTALDVQRVEEDPNGASAEEVASLDSDQLNVSEVSNFSE